MVVFTLATNGLESNEIVCDFSNFYILKKKKKALNVFENNGKMLKFGKNISKMHRTLAAV